MQDRPLIDPGIADERAEWCESVDGLIAVRGPEVAARVLGEIAAHARRQGVVFAGVSPYRNSLPAAALPPYPGDLEVEARLDSYLRWNAMAIVVRANKHHPGLGGHLSTYASTLTLWEVGFRHFFRGRGAVGDPVGCGDQVFFQGHASPGIYAHAFLEGRLSAEQLDRFRRELAEGGGLPSYPHPRGMPGFWEFPTVSLGIGPLHAVYQARFNRYLAARGLADTSGARVWCFIGDGETDEPETLAAIRLAAREHLDNLVFVVNGNLQRLDGPVRGNSRILDELEGVFAGAGWHVVKALWGSEWDALFSAPGGPALAERLEGMNDGDLQRLTILDAAELRETLFGGADPLLSALGEHLSDTDLLALRRGGHDPRVVHAAYADAVAHSGAPSVVLAQTVKGYALGPNFEGRNATHQMKKMTPEQLRVFRDILGLPVRDAELAEGLPPYLPLPAGSPEQEYLVQRSRARGGVLPRRPVAAANLPAQPAEALFAEFDAGSGKHAVSTTVAYTRLLRSLMRDPAIGPRVVPIVPDEGRTFGFEVLYSEFGIYAPDGQRYTPVDAGLPLSYREAPGGQVLQEGITEAGGLAELTAAATAGHTWDVALIPFFTYYSMFGFQRVGDLIWALADARGRGFLVGATAGRTTLAGEGLQHTDGASHLAALGVPACRAYDPAFAYETATIVRDGIQRMYGGGEECFYYLTVYNEDLVQPAKPTESGIAGLSVDAAIVAGMYPLEPTRDGAPAQVRLLASGPAVREAQAAAAVLADAGIAAQVWSVTSWKQLRDDALSSETWSRDHPDAPRLSHLQRSLGASGAPVVAVSDYVSALPDTLGRFVAAPFVSLGTDGYGVSGTREELRAHFGTDAAGIAAAATALVGATDDRGLYAVPAPRSAHEPHLVA